MSDSTVDKRRISIGSVDKEIPELSDLYRGDFRTRIGKKWGEEFERKMFTYMLVMAVEEIYVYTETYEEGLKWTCKMVLLYGKAGGQAMHAIQHAQSRGNARRGVRQDREEYELWSGQELARDHEREI